MRKGESDTKGLPYLILFISKAKNTRFYAMKKTTTTNKTTTTTTQQQQKQQQQQQTKQISKN
jgi:hypothetical protein